jgi:hypothetical protein
MTKSISLLVTLLIIFSNAFSQQQFPSEILNSISNQVLIQNQPIEEQNSDYVDNLSGSGDAILRQQIKLNNLKNLEFNSKSVDTLFIGLTPNDSLHITGSYNFDGTIVVYNDGKLVFEDSDALVNGDLLIFGNDAKVWIMNSTVHFPQSFIYQRGIIVAGNAELNVINSTLDYYGLPHDLSIADNAVVNWTDVTKIGFTTCGLTANASINIDGTNQAGEFIMMNNATANFQNATTILVWHHIPATGSLDILFPDGTNISNNEFNNINPGVTGIDYSYSINNCNNVMWGLMPEPESSVTITDSYIRTVGVWFRNLPAYQVSGLVNNSHYSDFTAPLSDHNIHFINSDVSTWSLYMFNGAEGNVESCILGEIGTMSNSKCTAENCLIDGSGGYLFATDTSIMTSAFSYLNCNFQSSGNSFGIMAYGGQNMGRCIAFEKSIMIIVQANLSDEPEYIDDALMWFVKIDEPSSAATENLIPILGSAWIDKASNYYPTEFDYYVIEYQPAGSIEWLNACDTMYTEVYSNELCLWNTAGLAPGSYNLRITMCDNTEDHNKVEAIKTINLSQGSVTHNLSLSNISVFPNPITANSDIHISTSKITLKSASLIDINGKVIANEEFDVTEKSYNISSHGLKSGSYRLILADVNNLSISIPLVISR